MITLSSSCPPGPEPGSQWRPLHSRIPWHW